MSINRKEYNTGAYDEFVFNIDHGYLEGLVRGFKGGILNTSDYANLVQCDTLEGRLQQ